MLKDLIHPTLQSFLPKELVQQPLKEVKANCSDCIMARPHNKKRVHYNPKLKCCTFEPFVPNFSVGYILKNPSLTGISAVQTKIQRREYALPIGMVAPVRFQVEFSKRKVGDFGQKSDWLCPYYDFQEESCGIWPARGSVCTSFYCHSSYGDRGLQFWKNFGDFLHIVEMSLMEEALVELDFSPRQISELLGYMNRTLGTAAEMRSWVIPEAKFKMLWNGYDEDIEGFYLKTLKWVEGLSEAGFYQSIGELGEKALTQALKSLKPLL
ncbi:MAG: hypothetical protein LW875_07185 [Proteobacteria bacterium]|nr:hypothetical protein [Pseudomonadota bacterium]